MFTENELDYLVLRTGDMYIKMTFNKMLFGSFLK